MAGLGVRGLYKGYKHLSGKYNSLRSGHIFRDSRGHVNPKYETSQGRYSTLYESTAIPKNHNSDILSSFQRNNTGYAGYSRQYNAGEVWVQTRNGEIINAGVNR